MITLYARLEPTKDDVILRVSPAEARRKTDAVFYADSACTILKARWSWHISGKPTRSRKTVTLNCCRYDLEWVA